MLEMSPQPRPGLPPTGRWKVKRRWGASDPRLLSVPFLFRQICPPLSYFSQVLISPFSQLDLPKGSFTSDRYGSRKVHYDMSKSEDLCYFHKFCETQPILATGLQLTDQLFQTTPLHWRSSLRAEKDIEVNRRRKWKWDLNVFVPLTWHVQWTMMSKSHWKS